MGNGYGGDGGGSPSVCGSRCLHFYRIFVCMVFFYASTVNILADFSTP
jgi:hypothetical protein